MRLSSIVFLLLAFETTIAYAIGYVPMLGTTPDGYMVAVDCEEGPCNVEAWKKTSDREARRKSHMSFTNEPCQGGMQVDKVGRETFTFFCDPRGKSPLAGASYVGRQVNGNCERGEPEYRFKCVVGCDSNSHAPRELTIGYWEC
jgi:hypothetical protein